jgi:phage regulator Rha-like protein
MSQDHRILNLPAESIERRILLLRGQKVMLDSDLAALYGVKTKILNKAVKRNRDRFPEDFMFRLTAAEERSLRFQIGTLKQGRGQHRKYLPFAFTEQGVAMLSSVLRSKRAIQVNIVIMRAFVKLRQMLVMHRELAKKLTEIENQLEGHDVQIRSLFEVIRQLMAPPEPPRRRIGFHTE